MRISQCMATNGFSCTTLSKHWLLCDVTQPLMSLTRLAEQGFNTQLSETPTLTHSKGFTSTLKQREGLYFLPVTLVALLPANMRIKVNQTAEGTTAKIALVTLTPTGMEILRNRNDLWTFNSQGFLVRVHRTQRKALFMPDNNCPVPTERLENYGRTVIQQPGNNTEVIEEAYQNLDKRQQKRVIQKPHWTGRNMAQGEKGNTPSRQHTHHRHHHHHHQQQPESQHCTDNSFHNWQTPAPMYRHTKQHRKLPNAPSETLLQIRLFNFLRVFATFCSRRACQAKATWLKPTGNPAGQQNSMARKDEVAAKQH